MHRLAPLVAIALITAATPTRGSAQATGSAPGVIEFGVDAGIATTLGGDYHITTVSIPTSTVRAGFYVNNHVSFEPSVGITSISGGGDRLTTYDASIGVLLHGRAERVGAGVYLRPFAGITGVSTGGSGSSSDTQTRLGVGLGSTIPFAERIATRLELSYAHGFASTYEQGQNTLAATIGLSFFNH
jgi:hypothetical protein